MTNSGPASAHVLAVRDARKRFGSTTALDGVSFEVHAGELLGLLGPNGAGKTTTIKGISGRVRLDAGTIQLFGRTLATDDPRSDLGVVPQEAGIYPLLTARENLEVFGTMFGVARGQLRARVDRALDWAGLADRASEPVKRFSGGMKRRLNIACGLVHAPRLVLLDEPTVGVDPQSRARIYEMLAELRASGVSIVLTTHHLEEAEQRCERIVIIDHGRVVAQGTLPELVARTTGAARRATIALSGPWPEQQPVPPGSTLDDSRRLLHLALNDIGADLTQALARIQAAGATVNDVAMTGTTLQDVFLALTGRELRE